SMQKDDLDTFRHVPAIDAAYELKKFDSFMGQDVGSLVDADGRLRCGILPLAQRSGRNSTVKPNLMGMPAPLRPLLLPDEGCVFLHYDYEQQEPGVAGSLSGDSALIADFCGDDVYLGLGRRIGVITPGMSKAQARAVRKGLLKVLLLSIIYGRGAYGVARALGCTGHEARLHLAHFERTYPALVGWLRRYTAAGLERGWAENVIGLRAAFDAPPNWSGARVVGPAQTFVVQSPAAACFQLTGVSLDEFNCDIRLPIHDAYLLNVANDPLAIREEMAKVQGATEAATGQLF